MSSLDVIQVDAFTSSPLTGNPCAVVLDASSLDDATMQAIALEMNLSETAFVVRQEAREVEARYFTPAEEIPFAGHPTVATFAALLDSGQISAGTHRLKTPGAAIEVEVATEARGAFVTMTQRPPQFGRTYAPEAVAPLFGLNASDFLTEGPIQTVSTGTPMLMVPVLSHDALKRASLNVERYRAIHTSGDFFSPHLFCLAGATAVGDTFARHFGVPPDTAEDPFTGSATGCMAAYLWRYGLIKSPAFVAEQGHWMNRPGAAEVEVLGSRDDIRGVRVGGAAVVVLRGVLHLG
ncbi:MAG: PhzF family phenazine biosynthesis protein [Bacteroidota bacterium]